MTRYTLAVQPCFFQFLEDDSIEISNIHFIKQDLIKVFYHSFKEALEPQANLNIFMACFTHMYGRMKLYDGLNVLKERVLYFDTACHLQESHRGGTAFAWRNSGRIQTQLEGDDYIVDFASAGPKNYAYILHGQESNVVKLFSVFFFHK